jgi:aryl-alcohol dehydrogenase-like predicted oxidoreductase
VSESVTHLPIGLAGKISGVKKPVFRLLLGTAVLSPPDKAFAFGLLDEFVRLGGNSFETAHSYGDGDCERMLGKWIAERNNREQVVVVSKCAHPWDMRSRVLPQCIDDDLDESLNRLRTDYVDVYMLHRDDPNRPVSEIMECLDVHCRSGKIHAIGASNWSPTRIAEANEYAARTGLTPFAVGSPHISLARLVEIPWAGCIPLTDSCRQWYMEQQFPIIAWSSQARGFFSGRYDAEAALNPETDNSVKAWFSPDNFERLRRAKEIGTRLGRSTTSVALAYVLSDELKPFAAIGPMNITELQDSFDALKIHLAPAERKWLNLED